MDGAQDSATYATWARQPVWTLITSSFQLCACWKQWTETMATLMSTPQRKKSQSYVADKEQHFSWLTAWHFMVFSFRCFYLTTCQISVSKHHFSMKSRNALHRARCLRLFNSNSIYLTYLWHLYSIFWPWLFAKFSTDSGLVRPKLHFSMHKILIALSLPGSSHDMLWIISSGYLSS